jgi:hypothetical protein
MSTPERHGTSTKRFSGPPKPGLRLGAAVTVFFAVLSAVFAVAALAAKPQYVLPPEIGGKARLGERLVCGSGTWKGSPSFKYQWVREGLETTAGPSYTLSKADEHKEVWCVVTATIAGESSTAESVNSICLAGPCGGPPPEPLGVKVKPKVSGSATVGSLLSCSQGEWSGRPAPTFVYKWLRDKSEPIKGATSATYTIAAEDETHALSCRVTASNGLEELSAESENSVTVPGTAPKNTTVPTVLGEPSVNEALTCYEGTWSGSKPLTYEFRWLRTEGGVTKEIPLATGTTYIVAAADEGQTLSCRVTVSNGLGKAEKVSAAVTVAGKLKSSEAPKITGTPEETHTLSCSEGAWNQSELTFKYQWLRENETILGATSKEYKVATADRGHLLYCQVGARNKKGEEVHATSAPFGIRNGPGVPKELGAPVVTGEPLEAGTTLTCQHGSWTGSPTGYVYQWQREESAIAGATASTYKLSSADEGNLISCRVIAQNSEGPSEAAESAGRYVKGEKPTVTSAPEVYPASESSRVGQSLTCLRGEWKGAPTPTFEYEWLRDGSTKVGANASYTITPADRGHELSCNVTAKNKEGEAEDRSANTVKAAGIPPTPPIEGPAISGEANVGKTLTCAEGKWEAAPAPTFTFQWLLNGNAIPSQTAPTFTIVSADQGFSLACRVTGTNSEGSESSLSKAVHIRGAAPAPEELPFVSGSAIVGQTLTCERGTWKAKPPPSFSYQWLRDGAPISGATEEAYAVETGDQGHRIACNVTATNSEGSTQEESANVMLIASRVTLVVPPPPSGKKGAGSVLPSPGAILASLKRQLATILAGVKIGKITKAGSISFAFLSPSAGTLQVQWFKTLKGAHGAKSKQLLLAQSMNSFTAAKKAAVTLRLTSTGRHLLKRAKRISLQAKVSFTIAHHAPVTWSLTLSLKA